VKRKLTTALCLLAAGACASVLGLTGEQQGPFEHRAHTLAGVTCTDCHAGIVTAGDEGPLHRPTDDSCVTCHEEPHDKRACSTCHGLDIARTRAQDARDYLRFSHEEHLPKTEGNCARCHVGVARDEEYLLPKMATCVSCHEHRDPLAGEQCSKCHSDLLSHRMKPASHLVHEVNFLAQHGTVAAGQRATCTTCHLERDCAKCHGVTTAILPSRFDFATPTLDRLHPAGFKSRHREEARAQPGLCATCHTPSTCQSCHADRGLAADGTQRLNPHPARWVGLPSQGNLHGLEARRDPMSCASCHSGAGEMLCVSCHRVGGVGGTVHPVGWTSNLRPEQDVPCRLCHGGLQ